MLVVDRVVLEPFEQPSQMRELECGGAPQRAGWKPLHEVVQVGNLREHVVPQHEIGRPPLVDQALRKLDAEEIDERLDTPLLRRARNIGSRIDPEHQIPLGKKCWRQLPSFEASSTTRLSDVKASRSEIIST